MRFACLIALLCLPATLLAATFFVTTLEGKQYFATVGDYESKQFLWEARVGGKKVVGGKFLLGTEIY